MRRTSWVILAVAVAGLVVTPTSAGAGVDNGGCPPENSNWALERSADDAYADELAESIAAGFTVQDILDFEGVATEGELRDLYQMLWDSIDKNGDGATCVADFFGFEKKYPWAFSIIDNVLPH